MNNEKPHSGFTKWFLKNIFGIDLEARSSEHRATLATIREQLENVIADRQNEIDRLKQKSETLHTQLDESNHQLEELQAELHKYKVDQTTLKSAKTHAENQLKKLKVESQKQVDDSKKTALQLESTLKQKTKELADVNSSLDGLRAQIEQLEKQKKDLEDDFSRAQTVREQLTADNKQLEQKIARTEKLKATQKQVIDDLKRLLESTQKEKDELQVQLATSQDDQATLKSAKTRAENQLKKIEAETQKQVDESKRIAQQLEATIKQKTKELADSNATVDALRSEIEDIKKQLEKAKEDIECAIKFRKDLASANAKLDGEKLELKHQVNTQKEIIDGQQAEIDALKKANGDLQAQLADSEKRVADAMKENEAINQQLSELATAQQDDEQEDDTSLHDQVKILAQELSEARSEVQRLTEELDNSRDNNKKLEATITVSNQKYGENLETFKARLLEKDEIISELKNQIKQLEAALAEMRLLLNESNDVDDDAKSSTTFKTTSANSPLQPQQSEADESTSYKDEATPSDLPTIAEDGSSIGERAIKTVINCETEERIDAEEFFSRPKEEISTLSRKLEIISKTDDSPLFVCEKCKQPVKISKITRSRGETLFFAHCHHDVSCEWRKESEAAAKPAVILDDAEIKSAKAEKSRYDKLKDLIYKSLINQEALGHDVSDVELDKRIKSDTSKSWRQFDVYAKWQGIDVVFKLQRSTDYLKYLVGIDEFCKQEKLFIIWVFGSDSATSYSYLLGTTYQATLFDNRSCVFILDREAENASNESGELKLKCNWLIDGKHWYHTIARTNSNGILVSLADLCFDDTKTYKPYYKDRNNVPDIEASEILELKPGIFKYRRKALWGIYNQSNGIQSECKYKEIYLNEKGRIVAIIDDIPEDRHGYLSDDGNETHTTKDEIAPGIFVLNIFERLCLADKSNRPISKYYDAMKYWCDDRMVIKLGSWYGIMDFHGRVIREPQYDKLRIVSDNKARVTDYQGKYSIDCDGNIIPDEIISLHWNYQKVRHLDKWGIMNAKGKLIVDYQYNEIATFRNRFFGFTDAGTIIKLENIERFNYRIPLRAKYIGTSPKGHLLFNCNGIILTMINHQNNRSKREIGKEYMVALINIMRDDKSNVTYYIAAWNEKSKDMKFVPTDFDSDYKSGQRYTGVIVKISTLKNRKRFFVSFKDNRQTYVNIGRNAPIFDLLRNGSSITLEKIDFNPFYESTKWKVIK